MTHIAELNKALALAGLSPLAEEKVNKLNEGSNPEVHYSPKGMGAMGSVVNIDATNEIAKLAEMLGIPDGWQPVKIGKVYAAFSAGDRLSFFEDERDFETDE